MTKKILLLFALVASMVSSASAYVIIIQGGGQTTPTITYDLPGRDVNVEEMETTIARFDLQQQQENVKSTWKMW